jgi:hypothetical protein
MPNPQVIVLEEIRDDIENLERIILLLFFGDCQAREECLRALADTLDVDVLEEE